MIGAPLYNRERYLSRALDSLLAQTFGDFALILVDDASSDATAEICRAYEEGDRKVTFVRNPTRAGMLANWRRTFQLGRERFPDAEYFAWASDHDWWDPEWLEKLVAALDRHPEAMIAYPLSVVIDEDDRVIHGETRSFETLGVASPRKRAALAASGLSAGNMVYGLMRADAVERAGVFRAVTGPDRMLLLELSLIGQSVQVDEVLWRRRFRGLFSGERQRAALFPSGRAPWHVRLPAHVTHVCVVWWLYVARGIGRPELSRARALAAAWQLTVSTIAFRGRRRYGRLAKRARSLRHAFASILAGRRGAGTDSSRSRG